VADPVLDRVLHQRLQDHRRHQAVGRIAGHVVLKGETRPEAHPLHRQEGTHQRDLLRQRHLALGIHAQAAAEEVRQLQGHATRRRRIDRGQGADRIQAVEQEVRVDLGAQHAQFGFLGRQLHFEFAPLEAARAFEFQRQVLAHRRHRIQDHAEAEHQGGEGPRHHEGALRRAGRHAAQQFAPAAARRRPQQAGADRGAREHQQHRVQGPACQRVGAAQVIRRKAAGAAIHQRQRQGEQQAGADARAGGGHDQSREQQPE